MKDQPLGTSDSRVSVPWIVGDPLEADRDPFVLSTSVIPLGFPQAFIPETASFVYGTAGRDAVPRRRSRPDPGGARPEGDPAT